MAVKARQSQNTNTDRIEKRIVLRAPRSRVWRALTIAEQFGTWFGVKLDGEFAPSQTIRGKLQIKGYDHLTLELSVERIEPEHYFSYRWHPYAVDPKVDYSGEPTTLVEFRLEEQEAGTALTIVESGFDRIPLSRRAEAFRMNDQGWESQSQKLARYVEKQ
ncbi:MAG TPA: SRPBCC family protein [Gemmatimonadales bacterium]|jgi:uncharacterized protein YndB with AHSA1/START domain|nr:SRPBCC family protein [Gemmatimonadales bacterium]